MKKEYRLIWFQHFHKAAGTSIINLAELNNERFWPDHKNGNPTDSKGNLIELWKYSEDKLEQFVDRCEAENITFVATEWGLPHITTLARDARVKLITCLRNPLSRFISNFYYDLYYGYNTVKTMEDYVGINGKSNTMFNYYIRILSGHNINPNDIDDVIYLKGKKALSEFDLCIIMESGFLELESELGWTVTEVHSNRLSLSIRKLLIFMVTGKWRFLLPLILYPKIIIDSEFIRYFNAGNSWDIQLYNDFKELKFRN